MTEFTVVYQITRSFTDEELAHRPDLEEVMAIFTRQVEGALKTTAALGGKDTFGLIAHRIGPARIDGGQADG